MTRQCLFSGLNVRSRRDVLVTVGALHYSPRMRCDRCRFVVTVLYDSHYGGGICSGCFFQTLGRQPTALEIRRVEYEPCSIREIELFGEWSS